MVRVTDPLRLLTVHAHPDDESSKGASSVAKYRAEGIPSTLVCCTGGEAGDILNPAMDRPEVRDNLAEVRREELARATEAIGYETVEMLGYHDSGMPDMPENARPDNFWNAPLDEAIGRLVAIIRRDRPQVIVTYPEDQSLDVVRLDGLQRANAEVGSGDHVTIRKAEPRPAQRVVFAKSY